MRTEGNIEETKQVEKPKKGYPSGVKTVEQHIEDDRISIAVLLMEQSERKARKHMRDMNFTDEEIKAAKEEYLERKKIRH